MTGNFLFHFPITRFLRCDFGLHINSENGFGEIYHLNMLSKVKSGTVFSNFLMSDDPADAAKAAEGILEKMKAEEAAKKAEDDAKKAEEPEEDEDDELVSI